MNNSKKMNLIISTFFIALGFGNLLFSEKDWGPYTNIVYFIAGCLGVLLIVNTLISENAGGKSFSWGKFETGIVGTIILSLVLIPVLGFYTTMLPATSVISILSGNEEKNVSTVLRNIVFSVVVTLVVFLLFSLVLGLKTPRGILI